MTTNAGRKRPLPWMLITLLALAGFIAWRMAGMHADGGESAQSNAMLQAGITATVRQEAYACTTPDVLSRSVAFKLAGAQDKLRDLLAQHACMLVAPQQRLRVMALRDKLARVDTEPSSVPMWMAARELVSMGDS